VGPFSVGDNTLAADTDEEALRLWKDVPVGKWTPT
jgi:hypothetical protein